MCEDSDDQLWRDIEKWAEDNNDDFAQPLLDAGIPVCYIEDDTPVGYAIMEYPDGKKELVAEDDNGDFVVVKTYE
ncbi:hypothetical protein [Brackiella oedipodis]|uniref:hypothetical protein n=1 Tax=Brackiella oedipodis TaxID=124225 RepID=UPI0005702C1C|nr:hypothetical protein [Brackiella oedipodis]